ncbi:MAG: IclR family transcriptional regulator [Geobacteraceae bacterium]|nr:MAG: IclR family transcriptional regulator [Geobacteraceae bacterium]
MSRTINSLEKGLRTLLLFSIENETLSAQEISNGLKIPLSTTYRYLETLTGMGFLMKNPDRKTYQLGIMLLDLGNMVSSRMKLSEKLLPLMKSFSLLSEETILFNVISEWEAVCVESVSSRHLIILNPKMGRRLPLHAAASSKVLLAYQEDAFIDSYLARGNLAKLTENTITAPAKLKKDLAMIRKQGYAFTDEEANLGVAAVGAPVLRSNGKIAASLTIAGPRERIIEKKNHLINLIKKFSLEVSQELYCAGRKPGTLRKRR